MKHKHILYLAAGLLAIYSCNPKNQSVNLGISPEAGTNYKQGDKVSIKVAYPADMKTDSVVYLLDSARLASRKDSSAFELTTDSITLGPKIITAKIYAAGQVQEVSTNINVLAARAPEAYGFEVEKTFPHDTSSYIEGLVYHNGFLYESDGGRVAEGTGQSSLRKVDLTTGKVLQKTDVDPKVFAEGIALVDDKIVQLTYTEKIGYVYDANTFKLLQTFTNNVGIEGWGMCYDGKQLYMDDSSNRIWFLDKNNYHAIGSIDVYDDQGPVNKLNELEYINGKIYANVYETNDIVVIDPKTGAVLQRVDLSTLYPEDARANSPGAEVMNGIAWDAAGKRLFVTGKKWPKLYQIKLVKK
ncbi:glutaminyl-peptide cyclotransferase [Mucilaginibacter sp. PAMB04274]|uniref:glutaminyl-peptide cyclotransferase n=1 Tax=Mucilaginibacter sp. PAMB04274 TaxID=3138568 RepID=UPI0031F5F324